MVAIQSVATKLFLWIRELPLQDWHLYKGTFIIVTQSSALLVGMVGN